MLGGDDVDYVHDDSLRVERILLELVRPDRFSHAGAAGSPLSGISWQPHDADTGAARTRPDGTTHCSPERRPFTNVLDLLGNPMTRMMRNCHSYHQKSSLLRDLVNLAITSAMMDRSTRDHRGRDAGRGIGSIASETGERRYWATWLLRDFITGYESDGMIPVSSSRRKKHQHSAGKRKIPHAPGCLPSRWRVRQPCVLLHVHGYEMPGGPVPMDFYRQH